MNPYFYKNVGLPFLWRLFLCSLFNVFIPFLFLMTFMEKFGDICKHKDTTTINHIKKCHGIYNSLQKGFGSFYLFNFTVIQLNTILNIYRTISIWLTEGILFLEMSVTCFGTLLFTLTYILNGLSLTLTIEETFQNLKSLESLAKQDLGSFILQLVECNLDIFQWQKKIYARDRF